MFKYKTKRRLPADFSFSRDVLISTPSWVTELHHWDTKFFPPFFIFFIFFLSRLPLNATATLQEELMSFPPARGNTSSLRLHNVRAPPPGNGWSAPRLPAAYDTSRTCCKNLLNNSRVQSLGNTLDGTHLKAHSVTSSGEKGYCKPCYVISHNTAAHHVSNQMLYEKIKKKLKVKWHNFMTLFTQTRFISLTSDQLSNNKSAEI